MMQTLTKVLSELLGYPISNSDYDNDNHDNHQEAIRSIHDLQSKVTATLFKRRDLSKELKKYLQDRIKIHHKETCIIENWKDITAASLFTKMASDYLVMINAIQNEEYENKFENQDLFEYVASFRRAVKDLDDMQENCTSEKKKEELKLVSTEFFKAVVKIFIIKEEYPKAILLMELYNKKHGPSHKEKFIQYMLGYCYKEIRNFKRSESALTNGLLAFEFGLPKVSELDYQPYIAQLFPVVERIRHQAIEETSLFASIASTQDKVISQSTDYYIHKRIAELLILKAKHSKAPWEGFEKAIDEMRQAEQLIPLKYFSLRSDVNFYLLRYLHSFSSFLYKLPKNSGSEEKHEKIYFAIKERLQRFEALYYKSEISRGFKAIVSRIELEINLSYVTYCIMNKKQFDWVESLNNIFNSMDQPFVSSEHMKSFLRAVMRFFMENSESDLPSVVSKVMVYYEGISKFTNDEAIKAEVVAQLVRVSDKCVKFSFAEEARPLIKLAERLEPSLNSDISPHRANVVRRRLSALVRNSVFENKKTPTPRQPLQTLHQFNKK